METTSGRSLRIIINGSHAKSGGGVTYLRRLLPVLAQQPGFELHLFLQRDQFELFYPFVTSTALLVNSSILSGLARKPFTPSFLASMTTFLLGSAVISKKGICKRAA